MSDCRYAEIACNIPLGKPLTYAVPEGLACELGQRVQVPLGSRKITGYVISVSSVKPKGEFAVKELHRVIDAEPVFGPGEIQLARWMSDFYVCSLGEALAMMLPGGKRDTAAGSFDADDGIAEQPRDLSSPQQEAVQAIKSGNDQMYYLHGVTGSGKTEVFLQAAEHMIGRGEPVIYLVPEISLTHQLAREVTHRFQGTVALMHSAMTGSQRLHEWMRIKRGEVMLVIGARSAVFAPFERPGLIIIDEEHENSYKSGSHPRYHARQVALKRMQLSGGKLVMGSATPSLEAWRLQQEGVMKRLELPDRISGGDMPDIQVVDLSVSEGPLSRELTESMREVLERGKQVILFLNRRGFSYFFHCRSCGYEMHCPHCSVSLTFHRKTGIMRCHYCGYVRRPEDACPECSSLDVGYSGFGTEMVEKEVEQKFPRARKLRVDTDSVKNREFLQDALRKVREGEVDILLGTQMIAKGLNFPHVELVGIVLADSSLRLPDFRAQERTFSLITQVSGRAGRFSSAGKVIVQTYHPENPAVRCAAAGDLPGFYQQELTVRESLGFPPYKRFCRIVMRGKDKAQVEKAAGKAADFLQHRLTSIEDAEVLGPSPCPVERIAGNWREQLIIRSSRIPPLLSCAHAVKKELSSASKVYIEIDIDPLSLM